MTQGMPVVRAESHGDEQRANGEPAGQTGAGAPVSVDFPREDR